MMAKMEEVRDAVAKLLQKHGAEITPLQLQIATLLASLLTDDADSRRLLLLAVEEVLNAPDQLTDREVAALNDLKNILNNLL